MTDEKQAEQKPEQKGARVIQIRRTAPEKGKKEIQREHREWKRDLCNMIMQQSRVIFHDDGSYLFLLPPPLVKLVWQTTIQERVALEKAKGKHPRQAWLDAMTSLRDEIDDGQARLEAKTTGKMPIKQAAPTEAEEEAAQRSLEELRVKLIKEKEQRDAGEVSDVQAEGQADPRGADQD